MVHVSFVCTGNICRSPMAEKVFAHQLRERGVASQVRVSSAGTGGWHTGQPADRRAARVLAARGYPTSHRAAQLDDDHLGADLLVALGREHARALADLGVPAERVALLRSFNDDDRGNDDHDADDDRADDALDVADPYYGDDAGFEATLAAIEASLPGLHRWVDERLAASGRAGS